MTVDPTNTAMDTGGRQIAGFFKSNCVTRIYVFVRDFAKRETGNLGVKLVPHDRGARSVSQTIKNLARFLFCLVFVIYARYGVGFHRTSPSKSAYGFQRFKKQNKQTTKVLTLCF